MVFVTRRDTSAEEVNQIFREEAESAQYAGILAASDEPLVSSDIVGNSHASIVDLEMTQVVSGNLVKVMCWYDNEWGFTSQMIREGLRIAGTLE
jgi:glyceraldehyde 3-phosphate dehydrogenase